MDRRELIDFISDIEFEVAAIIRRIKQLKALQNCKGLPRLRLLLAETRNTLSAIRNELTDNQQKGE